MLRGKLPSAGTTGCAVGAGGVSVKTPVVSVSSMLLASGELMLTASVVATLVGSGTAAPPGGGVGGVKASPLVALTLLVKFKLDCVAALVALRHKKTNICVSK